MFGRVDLLAPGAFENVAVTVAGVAAAFASRVGDGGNTGIAWDLARGVPLGVPVPAFPSDGDEWAFGALPGPRGDSPCVAWAGRERLHVQDLHGGDEIVIDDADAAFPDLLGLVVHGGRGAVVALYDQRPRADLALWDARTGERLGVFEAWFGHWGPGFDRFLLHATPAAGPLVALTCDTERGEEAADHRVVSVLDMERGQKIAELPSWGKRRSPMVPWGEGVVLVQPESRNIVVRRLDGEVVASVETSRGTDDVVAARVDGRLLVAAATEPDVFTVWDAARPEPLGDVRVPSPVNDAALAHDGTFLAATDEGLYRARVSIPLGGDPPGPPEKPR